MTSLAPDGAAPSASVTAVPQLPGGDLLKGRALVLLAGLFWSFAGLFVRLIEEADAWQILLYRSFSMMLFLLCVLAWRNGRRTVRVFREAGLGAVLAGFFLAIAFSSYVLALMETSVANVLFLLSAAPLVAAFLGRVILKERLRRTTWMAIGLSLVGVAIMVSDGLSGGNPLGDLLGLGTAFGFAGYTVVLRRQQAVDMLPSVVAAGAFGTLFGAATALGFGQGLLLTPQDYLLTILLGTLQLGAGLVVYTLGAKYLPAAEAVLLTLIEVVLGPLWVWLAVGEVPLSSTLLGGTVMVSALLLYGLTGLTRRRPPIGVV